jgi:hypothetical protein
MSIDFFNFLKYYKQPPPSKVLRDVPFSFTRMRFNAIKFHLCHGKIRSEIQVGKSCRETTCVNMLICEGHLQYVA